MSNKEIVKGTSPTEREMEGGRRPTGISLSVAAPARPAPPDSEVSIKPRRRRLTASYKLKVVNRVEKLRNEGNGAIGAYLRSEGLYYSAVQKWKRQLDNGTLGTKSRGKRRKASDALLRENKALRRQNEALKKKLHKTELIVDLQKKISTMMELDNQNND